MFLLFLLFWIIFNGKFTLEILIIGLLISTAVFAFICKFMDYSIKKEIRFIKKSGIFLKYVSLLIIEIVKANIATIRFVFSGREQIEPIIVEFDCDLTTPLGRTLFANAITLTPGTITVSLEDNRYVVHCLDSSFAEGINGGRIYNVIKQLER